MKNFTFIAVLVFIAGLMGSPVFGIEYGMDLLEPGNPGGVSGSSKTFDDEWTVGVGETFAIDIWAADIPVSEELITSGFELAFNPAQLSIVKVEAFDNDLTGTQGNNPPLCCPGLAGPWDPSTTTQLADPYGAGSYVLILSQLGCVTPDSGRDVIIGRVTFQCLAEGNSEISVQGLDGFDTTVGCNSAVVYDSQMGTGTITISQEDQGTSTTTSSPSTTTSSIASSTTSSPSTTTTTIKRCLSESIYGETGEETRLLRHFRDRVLSQTAEGRQLINLYYLWSPAIVNAMEGNEEFKAWVKEMIDDALPMMQKAVE